MKVATMSDTTSFNWRAAITSLQRKIEQLEAKRDVRILIVEDDPTDVVLLTRKLAKFHCVWSVCVDPEQAVNMIRTGQFDLVFIDQRMPKLTGMDVIQAVQPQPSTRFVVISGTQQSSIIDEIIKKNHIFAPKPLEDDTLAMFLRPRENE